MGNFKPFLLINVAVTICVLFGCGIKNETAEPRKGH